MLLASFGETVRKEASSRFLSSLMTRVFRFLLFPFVLISSIAVSNGQDGAGDGKKNKDRDPATVSLNDEGQSALKKFSVAPGLRVGTELGRGFIDYKPIFAAARAAGLKYYFAEQEGPFEHLTPLEAAKVSYGYLHSMRV